MFQRFLNILLLAVLGPLMAACTHRTPSALPPASPIPPVSHKGPMGALNIQVIAIQSRYRIIIPTDNIFDCQTAQLRESAYPGLNALSTFLKKFMPVRIKVFAYTDNLGSESDNKKLTALQAKTLVGFFWQKGLSPDCFRPVGFGKDEVYNIASNRSIDGSLANRRIELIFNAYP